jgi:thiosulfate/3-mercaptopyruvate sulfurtransferase
MKMTAGFSARKLLFALLGVILLISALPRNLAFAMPEDPWTSSETVEPAQLVAELHQEKDPHVTVIYVGVRTLYNGAHIPGAAYYGPGSTEQGLSELKKFAITLAKNSDVVLYCGCCPLEKCPNLRPAFAAIKDLGFRRLRVLLLPTSFNTDWVEKGYPVQKGN